MRTSVLAAALVVAASSAALAAPGDFGQSGQTSTWDAATRNSNSQNYVTLYEQPNFGGRQFTYYGDTNEVYREGFKAKSAKTLGGPWTLCDASGRPQCQTVSGAAPSLSLDVASVEKGQGGKYSQAGRGQGGQGQGGQGQGGQGQGGRGGYGQGGQSDQGRWNGQGGQSDQGRWNGQGGQRDDSRGGFNPDDSRQGGFSDRGDFGPQGRGGRDVHRMRYMCRGGYTLMATFDDRRGTVEIRTDAEPTVILSQVRTSYGFRYESRSRQFYGSGNRATYSTYRGALSCRAD